MVAILSRGGGGGGGSWHEWCTFIRAMGQNDLNKRIVPRVVGPYTPYAKEDTR